MKPSRRLFLKQIGLASLAPWARADLLTGAGFARGTPGAEGVSAAGILDFLDAMERTKHELHSFMMVRHGKVVAEGWWSPYGPGIKHTMYSMSKSFTSTAVGFAVAEGRLTVDDKVTSFFPDDLPASVSENLAALRVCDLLSMSVGNEKEPTQACVKSENWVRTFLAQSITHKPGTEFMYNSAATYMCSAIVQKLTGQKVIDYLTPRLFVPLGITGMTWETCPRGINTGGWGLSIRTEGLARFGQLYLQKGVWNGKQILPARWIDEATSFKIQQPGGDKPGRPKALNDWMQGYCYQFWRCQHNAFRGDGAFGQFTIVLPEKDAVIVMTSETKDLQGQLDLVWQHLLPALKDQRVADEAADARLQARLASLALNPPEGVAAPPAAAKLDGRAFDLEAGDADFTKAAFEMKSDRCTLTLTGADASHAVTCGIGQWRRGETTWPAPRLISGGAPKPGTVHKVAASAAWKDERTLVLTARFFETPHTDTITCVFDDDRVKISFMSSPVVLGGGKDPRRALAGRRR
ncbi:MAG: beta-lactamase family protein [Verrucomicrobiaceae bacterium]|nr:beta-lactamase family protein [Verrucomicrobiaceae bacterium]